MTLRMASHGQEQIELASLRGEAGFCSTYLSDAFLLNLVRVSNFERVRSALAVMREKFYFSRYAWSPANIRRTLIEHCTRLSS